MLKQLIAFDLMPCNNEHQPLCLEGTSNSVIPDEDSKTTTATFETNGDIIEERRVNICAIENTVTSHNQTVLSEQKNGLRKRTASTRSFTNLQAKDLLPGETSEEENRANMDSCQILLTQYRIIIVSNNHCAACAIPLTAIDLLEAKDVIGLQINCKDGRIIKLRAENNESACTWYKRLVQKTCLPRSSESIFAFQFHSKIMALKETPHWLRRENKKLSDYEHEQLHFEFGRLKLNENNWRISCINKKFEICQTYPKYLIVPAAVTDVELESMSFGRYYRRFPTLVWRNRKNGAVLLRSSQPSIGFFGLGNDKDVTLYDKIRSATTPKDSKFLILDARSYTAAWANRAKGGGFEAADTYTNSEVLFMGLPNIHNIRNSFHQLRQLLNAGTIDPNIYLQTLQSTLWLQNIGQLFVSTERCINALCSEGVSVLVHCSDGWDRTTQIVSLCMLIADPYYRTFEGFETLIQRQWVEFGHKFADRSGILNGDDNEKSPVFLQFLDCVYQLWEKNFDQFEFNRRYLMKLVQHTFSGLFGTFIFNSIRESVAAGCDPNNPDTQQCFQVWQYLGKHNDEFVNPAYRENHVKPLLCYPKVVPELLLWRDAYCCTAEQTQINNPESHLHQTNGTGSTQDLSSDKANSTLSRSQSASSLASLEQSNSLNQSSLNYAPSSNGTCSAGLAHVSSTKTHENCSIGSTSTTSINSQGLQRHLDVDGLSLVPAQYEDRMLKQKREQERQLSCRAIPIAGLQNMQLKDGLINGKLVNGGDNTIPRRTRNESVESSFEFVGSLGNGGDCSRLKHNSSSSLTSVCQPSSFSSNCTIISDCIHSNGICKNGTLQEGVETSEADGIEMHQQSNETAGV